MPVIKTTVEHKSTTEVRISGKEILSFMPDLIRATDHVTVEFFVPSGGDYNGVAVAIDEVNPIVITIERFYTNDDPMV